MVEVCESELQFFFLKLGIFGEFPGTRTPAPVEEPIGGVEGWTMLATPSTCLCFDSEIRDLIIYCAGF
jgi:hypothetical protein